VGVLDDEFELEEALVEHELENELEVLEEPRGDLVGRDDHFCKLVLARSLRVRRLEVEGLLGLFEDVCVDVLHLLLSFLERRLEEAVELRQKQRDSREHRFNGPLHYFEGLGGARAPLRGLLLQVLWDARLEVLDDVLSSGARLFPASSRGSACGASARLRGRLR